MSADEPVKAAKEGVSLLGEIIKVAATDPQAKEAAGNLGRAAVTLTKAINNVLLPIAAVNFAFEKAKVYFNRRFEQDLLERAAQVPECEIVEPKAVIAGPALQGLAFVHEEPALRDMYLGLLATALDRRVAANAHPAFVEVIKQLDAEDAELLQIMIGSDMSMAIVELRLTYRNENSFQVLYTNLLETDDPEENDRLPALIDNWRRLGLVNVSYDESVARRDGYSWVESRPELSRLRAAHNRENEWVTWQEGVLKRSAFGAMFARAVGIDIDQVIERDRLRVVIEPNTGFVEEDGAGTGAGLGLDIEH